MGIPVIIEGTSHPPSPPPRPPNQGLNSTFKLWHFVRLGGDVIQLNTSWLRVSRNAAHC